MPRSRRELAVFLSKLNVFEKPALHLEQYPTDSEVASVILWKAYTSGDMIDRHIVDLGCGTGILGIGALLLGAKRVEFVDIDASVYSILKENLKLLTDNWDIDIQGKWSFSNSNASSLCLKADVVITNPPFGTKTRHADKTFLEAATRLSPVIYTMHKTSTEKFINAFCKDNNIRVSWQEHISFPLKQTLPLHKKKIERIDVTLYRLEK